MTIQLDLPDRVEQALTREWGDLPRAAKEALAIESYRTGRMSLGLLAEMLGMGVVEADRWLADRGVRLNYAAKDLVADCDTLREVLMRRSS